MLSYMMQRLLGVCTHIYKLDKGILLLHGEVEESPEAHTCFKEVGELGLCSLEQ